MRCMHMIDPSLICTEIETEPRDSWNSEKLSPITHNFTIQLFFFSTPFFFLGMTFPYLVSYMGPN